MCSGSVQICGNQDGWLEPDYDSIDNYSFDEMDGDELDNDCDGKVDEGYCGDGVTHGLEECDGESWCS